MSEKDKTYIFNNPAMLEIYDKIDSISKVDAPVFIMGETGTGKEIISQMIQNKSERKKGSYIKINCPAIPKELIESELFGSIRGSYTGATSSREGYFSLANNGTILLDEISEMNKEVQSKLLRVLQEKRFYKVGSNDESKSDFRLIATTNRTLDDLIKGGFLREDLYHRISVIKLELPPLRTMKEDILPLAEFLLEKYADKYRREIKGFDNLARKYILQNEWAGNIREFSNCIESAVIFAKNKTISSNLLGMDKRANMQINQEIADKLPPIKKLEYDLIEKTLLSNGFKKNEVAKELGISRSALHYKLSLMEKKGYKTNKGIPKKIQSEQKINGELDVFYGAPNGDNLMINGIHVKQENQSDLLPAQCQGI